MKFFNIPTIGRELIGFERVKVSSPSKGDVVVRLGDLSRVFSFYEVDLGKKVLVRSKVP